MAKRENPAAKAKQRRAPVPRSEQRAATRERIREAAWALFSTVGFDETTTQSIAERAGVASGTVFLHASDKPDLLFLVMHDLLESTVDEAFAAMPEGPLVDRLMFLFRRIFLMYGSHPKMGAAFVKLLPGASGPNAQRVNGLTFGFLHRVSLLVTEAQQGGEVARDLVPLACAQNVFALYFAALVGWLAGHFTLDTALDPVLRSSLDLQMRGLRA